MFRCARNIAQQHGSTSSRALILLASVMCVAALAGLFLGGRNVDSNTVEVSPDSEDFRLRPGTYEYTLDGDSRRVHYVAADNWAHHAGGGGVWTIHVNETTRIYRESYDTVSQLERRGALTPEPFVLDEAWLQQQVGERSGSEGNADIEWAHGPAGGAVPMSVHAPSGQHFELREYIEDIQIDPSELLEELEDDPDVTIQYDRD